MTQPLLQLYVIKDRVSGVCSPMLYAVGHEAAKREMNIFAENNPTIDDMDMYHLGTFNPDTLDVELSRPQLVYNGSDALYALRLKQSLRRTPADQLSPPECPQEKTTTTSD